MSDSRPSVTIRMPAELMERIKAAAAASGRSMNAEIVQMLDAQVNTALGAVIDPWPLVPIDTSEVRNLIDRQKESIERTSKLRDQYVEWSRSKFTAEEALSMVPILSQVQVSVFNEQIVRYEEYLRMYESKLRWLLSLEKSGLGKEDLQ